MKVDLKCFDKLENPEKCESKESITYELEDGQNVGALVEAAGIKKEDIKIIFVNNHVADFETVLDEGDRIGLAPTVASLKNPGSCINNATWVNCGEW